ncbi:hypothetical protein MP638_004926 [Amoeboaphelidium occidentale]|nr:hypothetical protein MP638_004926 [Amoeboaphelidium occidentale]
MSSLNLERLEERLERLERSVLLKNRAGVEESELTMPQRATRIQTILEEAAASEKPIRDFLKKYHSLLEIFPQLSPTDSVENMDTLNAEEFEPLEVSKAKAEIALLKQNDLKTIDKLLKQVDLLKDYTDLPSALDLRRMQQEFSDKLHKHHYQNDEAERISQLLMTVAQRHYKLNQLVSQYLVSLSEAKEK